MDIKDEQTSLTGGSRLKADEKNVLFDLITNNLTNGIVLIKNNLIIYSNNAILKLTGYQPEEIAGKNYSILFSEEDARRVGQFFDEINIRVSIKIEIQLKNKNNTSTICILNAEMVDSRDPSLGLICTFSDITDRKKAEEKLRQSEEFYSALLDAISESLIGVDSNFKIVLFNTAAKILFKRSTIECIGQSPEILFQGIHKEIIKGYINNFIKSDFIATEKQGVIEIDGITSGDEIFPVEVSISPANFRGDQLILLSIRDVTRRKRYEMALKQKQQEQEALLNNIPDLVYFKNADFGYISGNQAFCSFVDLNEKEINGKTDRDFFPDDVANQNLEEDNSVVRLKESVSSEGILKNKNNNSIYTIKTRTPIFDDDNNIIGIVGIFKDITERREKEMALQRFTRELEETKKNLERKTFELIKVNQDLLLSRGELEKSSLQLSEQNKTLRESEVRLKNLNMQKDKFVSIISHDLRNPFTSILGHAELLQYMWNDTPDEKKLSYIVSISSAAQHQLNQLNNLLEWARFADGRIPFKPRVVLLFDVIKKSLEAFAGIRQKKNINIINNIGENIKILGDKNLLYRLFENLIGNALKFTPDNGTITLSSSYIEEENKIFISIKDSGIGIPVEILPSLFKLTGKVSRKGTAGEPGTGLGLILCREIVDLHQGNITVESKEGDGSIFTLNLALASPDVLVFTEVEENFQNLRICFDSLHKNFNIIRLSNFNEINSYAVKRYPCLLVIDLSNDTKIAEKIEEMKTNRTIDLLPILILKDEDDEMDKKLPANNIVQSFLKPLDEEYVTYNLSKIL